MAIARDNLGKALREKRGKRFTQEEIAEAVKLSSTQVSKIECGHAPIYVDTLGKWCDVLGVSVVEVLGSADSARAGNRFDELTAGCSPEFKESLLDICGKVVEAAKEERKRHEEEY